MNPVRLNLVFYSSADIYKNNQFNGGSFAFALIFTNGRPDIYDQAFVDPALDLKFNTLINTQ